MSKLFSFIVETLNWLLIFLSPFLISGIIAVSIYIKDQKLLWLSISIVIAGIVLGVIFAEKIRRKYGCTTFMARIISTPDIWPYEESSKTKKDETIH